MTTSFDIFCISDYKFFYPLPPTSLISLFGVEIFEQPRPPVALPSGQVGSLLSHPFPSSSSSSSSSAPNLGFGNAYNHIGATDQSPRHVYQQQQQQHQHQQQQFQQQKANASLLYNHSQGQGQGANHTNQQIPQNAHSTSTYLIPIFHVPKTHPFSISFSHHFNFLKIGTY